MHLRPPHDAAWKSESIPIPFSPLRLTLDRRIPVPEFSGSDADFIKAFALLLLVCFLFFGLGQPAETSRHNRAMEKIYADVVRESVAWRAVLGGRDT